MRSSDVIAARTGTPTTSTSRSPGFGTAESTRRADRAPTWFAQPALALASWITTGTRRRRPPAAGGQIRRQRDVAAESDDDVGVDVDEHGAGLPHRPSDPHRQSDKVSGRFARKRDRRDQFQVISAFGHQPGLQAALGAQCGDPHVRVDRSQRVGHRHRRFDMARGPTTREYHGYRTFHP